MGMEFRPYYLSKEWIKLGHNVRIVAGDYSHLRVNNPCVSKDFQEEVIDGIIYTWIKTGSYEGNGVARALTMVRFVWKLWINASRIAKEWQPDVIITSSTYPIDTFAGQRIKRKMKGIPVLIHEVHDMWPITLIELGGMKKTNPFVIMMQIAENSFCKHSDYVVSLLCAANDYFIRHGMAPHKFKNIMNGVVVDEWEKPEQLPEEHAMVLNSLHEDNKFIICFFGSITKSYAIDYLIDAMSILNNESVVLVIVGEGNQKQELMEKTKGNDSVVFLNKVSKMAIPSLLDKIDCCYVGALHNDMFRFGICMNKLFDSMMSGKPILYAVDAPNNFVNDYSCGVSVEAENADALADGINRMINMSTEERDCMGKNGRRAVLEYFTYEKLAKEFVKFFE